MANKKFLDFEGVRHLWSKINMQDYPNNDMLMDIIQAIDETKADKTDLIQSDWNQEDEFALDYIKNKPDERTAVEIVMATGLVSPVAGDTNVVYTDENNNVYIF